MDYKLLYACLILCRHYIIGLTANTDAQKTWNHASAYCKQSGGSLPVDGTAEDHRKLIEQMQKIGITRTWLGIRKTRHPTWIWLDGQPADHEFAKQNWRNFMNCGVLHLRDSAIEVDRCSKRTLGYVCEPKTKTSCSALGVPLGDCVETHNRVFVYGCDSNNWYDARFRCDQKSMDLALMRSEAIMAVLRQKWYRENRRSCEKLWMGLRREDWNFPDVSLQGQNVMQSCWKLNQPGDAGECATISKDISAQSYSWSTASCDSRQNTLCMYAKDTVTAVTPNFTRDRTDTLVVSSTEILTAIPQDADNNPTNGGTNLAAVIVPLLFIISGILIAGIGFVFWRKRRYSAKNQNNFGTTVEMQLLSGHKMEKEDNGMKVQKNNGPNATKNTERPSGKDTNFDSCNISDATLEYPIFHFTNDGGHYEVPDSGVTITFHSKSIRDCDMCSGTIAIIADMTYKLYEDEKMITPVIIFDLQEDIVLLKHVTIQVPHGIQKSSGKALNYIKVYQVLEDDKWDLLPDTPGTEDNTYYSIEEGKVVLYTKRSTKFLCTCNAKMLGPLSLSALMMANYDEEEDKSQELAFSVYILDALYDRKECINTLPDEKMDTYEHISLYHSSLPSTNQFSKSYFRAELQVDPAWQFLVINEGKDPHLQSKAFQYILPSEDSPVGREVAKFIIRRNTDATRVDILRYKLLLTVWSNNTEGDQIITTIGELEGSLNLTQMSTYDTDL